MGLSLVSNLTGTTGLSSVVGLYSGAAGLQAGAGGTASVPAAFDVGDWSLTDATTGGTLTVTISALPADNGAAISDVEYRIDGGSWTSSGGTTGFDITGLTDDVEVDVELRAVNAAGAGAASDVKAATPTPSPLLMFSAATQASATPSTVVLTVDAACTGFRVWSGQPAALGEGEWLLYVKKNSDAVFAVAMERYWGRILHAAPGDTFAFGTSDGRTLQFAQMVVPGSLIVPSGATGTANCDEALPLIWEPTAPHITLPSTASAFQIDADGTARWVFIAERDTGGTWSPPRVVRHSGTRDTIIQCNFAEIALANEAGATLDITAPTGSTIGGTKGVMSLDTIPAVTGTTHNVSTVAQFKTAIAAAVSGDAIAAASGTYAFDVAITDASFTANEGLGNQGAEGILIYGTTGDRDDVVLTGNGTSTNGSWTLTQGGASAFTTFKDLTFDFATYGIKFTASGGKFNFQNVLGKGGTGTDIFSFNNTAGALTVKALHTQLQDGAGDLWNFDGDATYNAASLVDMIGCSGLRPGPSNNSYQCATTHHDLPIRVHGGLWSDAHLNVFANGNATSITYAEFATITKGARTSGIANTHLYCCDWEVNPATTGNSTLLAAIGNHVTGAKDATSYAVFRNVPSVKRNVIAVTSGRGVHNSISAQVIGNIITAADTAIRNGDAASLQSSSNLNYNTLAANTTGLNQPTTTNDPAVFNSNAAKTNTTSVNTTAGAKTSLTGDYNVLDATVDADYVAGANDTTGTDAALDSDYFPTASGNCDDNGDYSKLGHVGGADPWGFVFAYKQNVVSRGARSLPIIRSGAELYPDVWSAFPITAPVLGDAAVPNIAGDWRPVYEIDFVDAYPTGGGIGDTLQCRYGDSQAAAEAVVTPDEAIVSESWWIDGEEPFPDLGDYGATLSVGDTLYWQVRVKRGSDYSDWSGFKSLAIADGVMTAPGWTDLTNQTASTRVWSSGVTVAGLGSGAYARLLGTGPLKVGSTVYEAGDEVQVQNGDTLYAGVDTSGTGGATVNNVVTNRGAALETFSATTAGAAADFTVTAAPDVKHINYGSVNADFANVQMNAGRNIIFVAGNLNNTTVSITIDGSSSGITLIDKVANAIENVYAYEVTIGANDTKDIRVTSGDNIKSVGIVVGVLSNAAAGAPSVVKLSFNWRASPISIGTMTIPADGIGIACAVNIDNAGTAVWTGATEISDNSATTISLTTAKLTSTANPTVGEGSGTWHYQYAGALGLIFDNA